MTTRLLVSASLLLTIACGGSDDDAEVPLPCDVRQRACQRSVFNATAWARGQQDAVLPPVRVITRDELAKELQADVGSIANQRDEEAERKQRQTQLALSFLKLMPEPAAQSTDDAYVEQAVASIAAYYSTYSKDITIIADQADDLDNGTFTLSHEFVHALQDQREGLTEWRQPLVRTSDDSVAAKSLTEGEATWLSYITYYDAVHGVGGEFIDIERIFSQMLTGFLNGIASTTAPLINALESLPYPMGGRTVAEVYLERGLPALVNLYEQPRLTLRAWAEVNPSELPDPLECELPAPPDGYQRVLADRLGFAGLLSFHTGLGLDGPAAYDGALPWRADEVAAYAAVEDAEAVAVAWRIRVDDELAAAQLAERANDAQLDARASGHEVLIAASSRAELLPLWLPHDTCLPRTKTRSVGGRDPMLSLDELLGIVR